MSKNKNLRNTPRTFMDDAEEIIRDYVNKSPTLIVWRGEFSHGKIYETKDTIIAGMSQEVDKDIPPVIPVLTVFLNKSAFIKFVDDRDYMVPFGRGWIPLKEVKKQARKLVSF